MRQLHATVAEIAGTPHDPEFAAARLGELTAITLDPSLARRELGWQPSTDLATGVAATYAWMETELG